ncbi:TonB-dependent receptor [Paracoccus seriniphilus]|uniref:TonB-dependent receptor n=1 Tax=Paracoccus seriniphilus TaxID=184748 RepID=UPI003563B904
MNRNTPLEDGDTARTATARHMQGVATTLGLLPTIALSTAFAAPVHAQSTSDALELDPIVVQGMEDEGYVVTQSNNRKATAPLSDTPQTINVITKEEIEDRGLTSVQDVLRTTPGVTLQAGEGGVAYGTSPVIRGYDSNSAITVDGMRNSSRTSYEAFNLESIQINKGASGTTAGRSASGGTINLETKKALIGQDFTDTSLTAGSGGLYRGTADINQTYGDTALRFNLMRQTADDLDGRKNKTSDRKGFAASVAHAFSSSTTLTAGLYYYEMHDMPDYGNAILDGTILGDNSTWYGLSNRDFRDNETRSGYLTLDHTLGNGWQWTSTLRAAKDLAVYVATAPEYSDTYGGVLANAKSGNRETKTISFNSQLSGTKNWGGVQHDLAFGVDLSREETFKGSVDGTTSNTTSTLFEDPNHPDNGMAWNGVLDITDRESEGVTKTTALYLMDTMTISPKLEFSAGLRLDIFDVSGARINTAGRGEEPAYVDLSEHQEFVNGNVGIVYHPTESVSLYGNIASSADPALDNVGIQTDYDSNAGGGDINVDPERTYTYEVGAKWMPNPNLLLGAALYRVEKENERAYDETTDEYYLAAESSRSQGVELTFSGMINERWSISGGYTYIDYSADGGETDYVNGVPEHAFSLWTSYDVTPKWTVGGGAYYTGTTHATSTVKIPDSWQIDVMARYAIDDSTSAQVNITNLFDEDIYETGYRNGRFVNMGAARTVSLTLNKSF